MDDKYETCNFLVEVRLAPEATARILEDYIEAILKTSSENIITYVHDNVRHSLENGVPIPWNTIRGGIRWKLNQLVVDLAAPSG